MHGDRKHGRRAVPVLHGVDLFGIQRLHVAGVLRDLQFNLDLGGRGDAVLVVRRKGTFTETEWPFTAYNDRHISTAYNVIRTKVRNQESEK